MAVYEGLRTILHAGALHHFLRKHRVQTPSPKPQTLNPKHTRKHRVQGEGPEMAKQSPNGPPTWEMSGRKMLSNSGYLGIIEGRGRVEERGDPKCTFC